MFQTDQPTAVSSIPTPTAAGTPGFFTGGNPGAGQPATIVDNDWLNMIQSELMNVVTASGQTPSKTTYTQVLAALSSMFSPVVGQTRNAKMSVTAVSTSATFTADEVVVGLALGGRKFLLGSFSQSVNLATTGAGGMDTGTAPVNGFVALYAIYNPTTGSVSILATNAATLQGNVYGGGNMPVGYTASALISIWGTNASRQFVVGLQTDRQISTATGVAVTSSTAVSSFVPVTAATLIPFNAKYISGFLFSSSSNAGNAQTNISGNGLTGLQQVAGSGTTGGTTSAVAPFNKLQLSTPQTFSWSTFTTGGTLTGGNISITGYEF